MSESSSGNYPPIVVALVLDTVARHNAGLSLATLYREVAEQEPEFFRQHPNQSGIVGFFPGKGTIRRIVTEVLVPRQHVKVLINGQELREFSSATTNGRSWTIVATEVSKTYYGAITAAMLKLSQLANKIKELSEKHNFRGDDFYVFDSLLSEVTRLPLNLYYEARGLPTEARLEFLKQIVASSSVLIDKLLEIRKKIMHAHPSLDFDEVISKVSQAKDLSDLVERPIISEPPGGLSRYRIELLIEDPVRATTVEHLVESIESLPRDQQFRMTTEMEPITQSMQENAWFLHMQKNAIKTLIES